MLTQGQTRLLERVIRPQQGDLSPDLAAFILKLDFSPADHARYEALSYKVQHGAMAPEERAELDDFLAVDTLLSILQSKARVALKQHNPAA